MPVSLLSAPPEILQKIVLLAVVDTPLGPPRELSRLSLACRSSHRILSRDLPGLCTDIFAQKFDIQTPAYRLGKATFQVHAKAEMMRRFTALKCFRRGRESFDDPYLTEAFWIAYLMLEDSDSGQKNLKQLLWAGLPTFLNIFLCERLHEGSVDNNDWPLSTERNSLAIALLWLLSSQSSVNREAPALRDEIFRLLAPYTFAAFRYPISSIAEYCFDSAHSGQVFNPISASVHGSYPPAPLPPSDVVYFGDVIRQVRIPSAPLYATLVYFSRLETTPQMVPPHLAVRKYKTRAEAHAEGHDGPILEDIDHFIHECQTRFAEVGIETYYYGPSLGLTLSQPQSYRLGTLTGRWRGSYIVPITTEYQAWLNELTAPPKFVTSGRRPLYISLQEHFCYDSRSVVPLDSVENGIDSAWLPPDCRWKKHANGIDIFDEHGTFRSFYETFCRDDGRRNHTGVVDVIVTGQTGDPYAAAWGDYRVLGRVRLSDGLVVLSRESMAGLGNELLRGYVLSSQNFVGRIKGVSSGFQPSAWEASFSLCQSTCKPPLIPEE